MRYVALLRGVNVGKSKRMSMAHLKTVFESLGYVDVSTYINSGNVLFEAAGAPSAVRSRLEKALHDRFGFAVEVLVMTHKDVKRIARAIPKDWLNDEQQRTDVAYVLDGAAKAVGAELPFNRDIVRTLCVKGAVIWNLDRKDFGRSRLNKIIGHQAYKAMTIRNANTARVLGEK